eukprot:scaffold52467_cov63-Phaeocystis_antarctica.AAC.1
MSLSTHGGTGSPLFSAIRPAAFSLARKLRDVERCARQYEKKRKSFTSVLSAPPKILPTASSMRW